MNPFLRQILAVSLLCFVLPVVQASATPKTEWRIAVKLDTNENPHSTVDLIINDKQAVRLVTPEHVTSFQVLPPAEYEDYRVPAKALCACRSWWAGAGTRFYVVTNPKGKLEIYRLEEEEEMTTTPHWRRVRTITVE